MGALAVVPEALAVIADDHDEGLVAQSTLVQALEQPAELAVYEGDLWTEREADGFQLSPDVSLLHVRGHSEEDIATLVRTDDGLIVFTHAWWTAEAPAQDPYVPDAARLHAARARILELSPTRIVPGHGAPFHPASSTPR